MTVRDVYLNPGEIFFGAGEATIRTILGSCVAITIWHPTLVIGGMCHFMLPQRQIQNNAFDGRYADEAIRFFLREIARHHTAPREYHAKIFGGGNMFPSARHSSALHVGRRNIETGLGCLHHHKFRVKAQHLAGHGHRNIVFEVWSGDVWVKHVSSQPCDER